MKITDEQARAMTHCPNCKEPKSQQLILCWECFKYIKDSFKNSGMSLGEWLEFKEQSRKSDDMSKV